MRRESVNWRERMKREFVGNTASSSIGNAFVPGGKSGTDMESDRRTRMDKKMQNAFGEKGLMEIDG
jgi:hypothetical protein